MSIERNYLKKVANSVVLVLVVVMMASSLVGCASFAMSVGGNTSDKTSICFITNDVEQPYRKLLAEGIQKAAEDAGVSFSLELCGDDVDSQIKKVESAAASGKYDALVCRLVDKTTILQVEVAAGDLPIAFVNNEPSADYLKADKYIFAGSYEQEAGRYQAEYVWNKLGKPSTLNAIILEGAPGHSGTIGRTKAVKNFFADNNVDLNIVFMDYAKWTAEGAIEKLDMFKITNQDFDCIFCNNDTMALGAVQWLKDNGYNPADYPVTGVDATADGCALVKSGDMYMTVLQDAKGQGNAAVQACIKMANGQSITSVDGASEDSKYVWVPFVPVDASNVAQYQ